MKFVFVDETENSTHVPGFYAVCAVAVNGTKYGVVRDAIDSALDDCGWCRDHEFKGSLIFCSTKGDRRVATEQRVDAASAIVSATVSKVYSRASSAVAWTDSGYSVEKHLELVGQAVARSLGAKPEKGMGRDIVVVFADQKQGVSQSALSAVVRQAVASRGYRLAEDVVAVASSCAWPGVLLADVIAYLSMWTYAGHLLGARQPTLFEGGVEPGQAVLDKMATVQDMLESGSELQFLPKLA